jgi:NAD(P)-dependent dehydrogenase (short-subunit alcohol dehydrogenase family)
MTAALVTGANRGIGLAVAQELVRRDFDVLLACRDATAGAAAAAATGGRARAVALDVADPESIQRAMSGIQVDILVNNAGTYPEGGILEAPMSAFRGAMEVHFFGILALCRAVLPGMIERDYGRIVNVSSGYGSIGEGLEGPAAYSLSKAALGALTVKLASEVQGDIKINAVCPGWVRTRMGGPGAHRTVEKGAETIVWLATLPGDGPHGGFFRDRKRIPW